jgi:hypothetical protein
MAGGFAMLALVLRPRARLGADHFEEEAESP